MAGEKWGLGGLRGPGSRDQAGREGPSPQSWPLGSTPGKQYALNKQLLGKLERACVLAQPEARPGLRLGST